MSSETQQQQQQQSSQETSPTLAPNETEILGIDHPLMTEELIDKLLPDGVPIPRRTLHRAAFLLTHPLEFDDTPPGRTKAIAAEFNAALNKALREVQQRNVREHGKARP